MLTPRQLLLLTDKLTAAMLNVVPQFSYANPAGLIAPSSPTTPGLGDNLYALGVNQAIPADAYGVLRSMFEYLLMINGVDLAAAGGYNQANYPQYMNQIDFTTAPTVPNSDPDCLSVVQASAKLLIAACPLQAVIKSLFSTHLTQVNSFAQVSGTALGYSGVNSIDTFAAFFNTGAGVGTTPWDDVGGVGADPGFRCMFNPDYILLHSLCLLTPPSANNVFAPSANTSFFYPGTTQGNISGTITFASNTGTQTAGTYLDLTKVSGTVFHAGAPPDLGAGRGLNVVVGTNITGLPTSGGNYTIVVCAKGLDKTGMGFLGTSATHYWKTATIVATGTTIPAGTYPLVPVTAGDCLQQIANGAGVQASLPIGIYNVATGAFVINSTAAAVATAGALTVQYTQQRSFAAITA